MVHTCNIARVSSDFLALRFNELGRAVWDSQRAFKQTGRGYDWRFTSYYDADSDWVLGEDVKASANSMSGQMYSAGVPDLLMLRLKFFDAASCCFRSMSMWFCDCQEWWDQSDEAGPKSRPGTQFEEERPNLEVLAFDQEQMTLKPFICIQVKRFLNHNTRGFIFLLVWNTGQLRLPDDIANSLGSFKKKLNDQLSEFNEKQAFHLRNAQQLAQPTGPRPSSSRNESSPAASPARTACRPLFEDGDCPRNLQKVFEPSIVLSSDAFSMEKTRLGCCRAFKFKSSWHSLCWQVSSWRLSLDVATLRPVAQSPIIANANISIVATDLDELWLLNDGDDDIKLNACELFGFGMGLYVPKAAGLNPVRLYHVFFMIHDQPFSLVDLRGSCSCILLFPGVARGEKDKYIPWILKGDTDTMIHVTESGKIATCISELTCNAAQRQGLTEMTLVDHSLTQRMKDLFRVN